MYEAQLITCFVWLQMVPKRSRITILAIYHNSAMRGIPWRILTTVLHSSNVSLASHGWSDRVDQVCFTTKIPTCVISMRTVRNRVLYTPDHQHRKSQRERHKNQVSYHNGSVCLIIYITLFKNLQW